MKEASDDSHAPAIVEFVNSFRGVFDPMKENDQLAEPEESPKLPERTYLEQLAELDLDGKDNRYLKQTLHRRFEAWESNFRQAQLFALAEQMLMSEAQVEELLQQRIEEIIQQSQFFCAVSSYIFSKHIINRGRRFKSAVELYGSVFATIDPTYRSRRETDLFGFPSFCTRQGELAKSSRPIYGYFSMDENGILNPQGKHPPRNCVSHYGRVSVKVKREVAMQRATVTLEDTYGIKNSPISPAMLPHFSAFFYFWEHNPSHSLESIQAFLEEPLSNKALWKVCGSFTEVQYHGGLGVEDIESVHLSLGNGLTQDEIHQVVEAVEAYNQETGCNIPVVIY